MKITKTIFAGIIEYRNEYGFHHNENGPAIIHPNGSKAWLINGKRHRLDGPAVISRNGSEYWYLNEKQISVSSQEEFERYLRLLVFI